VRIFKPHLSIPTWLGFRRQDRRVPIYNYFNRVPQPKGEGYSVRVTYARDYRGGRFTYDGHLGTDFAVPVGTPVVAAAPGEVVRVANDMQRGGLKVCIDHGRGLFTTSNHLSRALVSPGARVGRGDVVALSGASGIEFVLFFPWVAPHLHFNVWLDGIPVDPFARLDVGEAALWRAGNDPVPARDGAASEYSPTEFDAAAVDASIESCRDPRLREVMRAVEPPRQRAAEVLVWRNYVPSLFPDPPSLYRADHPRTPWLDLPFREEDVAGVAHP
jgi:hypothetical protein